MSTKVQDAGVKLTQTTVGKLAVPLTSQHFYRDTELRGFAVRVTTAGQKSYVLEKRIQGRVRRITLGRCSELTTAQARNYAQRLLGEIAMGEDPVARKRRERARSITLNEVYRDFVEARKSLRPTTRAEYDRTVNLVLADWASRPMHTISRAMILQRHKACAQARGEQAANNYFRVLRALFTFAMDRYEDGRGEVVIAHNPVLILTRTRAWYPVERRQTLVKLHQLAAWYRAVESLREAEHPQSMGDTVADFLLLLVFTGLRRNEAASLPWTDVDLEGGTFTIRRTKSHRPHCLPITDFVRALLLRRLGTRQNAYVFGGRDGRGYLIEPKRQIGHVIAASDIPFSCHDLRRTFITVAELLELSPYTIKRLVNHSTRGDVTAGYVISDAERLRAALTRIEAELLGAMKGPTSADGRPGQLAQRASLRLVRGPAAPAAVNGSARRDRLQALSSDMDTPLITSAKDNY